MQFGLKKDCQSIYHLITHIASFKLFELGRLFSGRVAQLAGPSRAAFLMKLKEYRVSLFALTLEELRQEDAYYWKYVID